jgi:pyridoxine/pyridoxamine 5'-phosphate oxidase
MVIINGIRYTLNEIEQDIWRRLSDENSAFRWGALATQTAQAPRLRMVVVRKVLPLERTLLFYTDKRSAKVAELLANPAVGWLFYDDASKIQIRLEATATLHTDDFLAHASWQETPLTNRREYLSTMPPSTPVAEPLSGLPEEVLQKELTIEESEKGRVNFMVVASRIHTMDWLHLDRQGHQRAQFSHTENGASAHWIIP